MASVSRSYGQKWQYIFLKGWCSYSQSTDQRTKNVVMLLEDYVYRIYIGDRYHISPWKASKLLYKFQNLLHKNLNAWQILLNQFLGIKLFTVGYLWVHDDPRVVLTAKWTIMKLDTKVFILQFFGTRIRIQMDIRQ